MCAYKWGCGRDKPCHVAHRPLGLGCENLETRGAVGWRRPRILEGASSTVFVEAWKTRMPPKKQIVKLLLT